jgi:hypothetical protein
MNKIDFISNQKDQIGQFTISDNVKSAEVSLKFTPGQVIYLIEDSQVIKRKIIQITVDLDIFEGKYDCDIVYILNNRKTYTGNQLFRKLEDIEIQDDTNTIENVFDENDLKDYIKEEPKELSDPQF